MIVRPETPADHAAIRQVTEAAFGTNEEATLIDSLRADGSHLLSLVAEATGQVVGHIFFSRMCIERDGQQLQGVALAPLAVLPDYQRQGIGGRLIREGLHRLRARDERIVIVVGHPDYYPRFGFTSARERGINGPFPTEAFMVLDLTQDGQTDLRGTVRYPGAFGIQ
jgi:putative acetyltransferase